MMLVTGATGHQGGAVLEALLARGLAARALVRDGSAPASEALRARGVSLVVGDLGDVEALAHAMLGVEGAFGLTTAGEDEVRQGEALLEAARRSSLPHLVLASVASAQRTTAVPHFVRKAEIERAAYRSPVRTTIVAPTWFFENLLARREDVRAGRLPIALPIDRRLQCVALADLGELVARILAAGTGAAGERIEVAGDELTLVEMAQALGTAVGRHVDAVQLPLGDVRKRSPDLAAMYDFLTQTGYHVDRRGLRARFPAMRWQSFAEWSRRQRW